MKFKCEVSPITMMDSYISALEKRKVIICLDGVNYIDVINSIETLPYESISIDELA